MDQDVQTEIKNAVGYLRMAANTLSKVLPDADVSSIGGKNVPEMRIVSLDEPNAHDLCHNASDCAKNFQVNKEKYPWALIEDSIDKGNLILAIKYLREYTNMGLKESKDLIYLLANSPKFKRL